jgi:hypothetical protein
MGRKAFGALILGFFLIQDRAGTPKLRTSRICTLYPESAVSNTWPRTSAIAGRDFRAKQTAGAVMYGALSWGWRMSCGHRFPHNSRGGEARERPRFRDPTF